MERPEHVDFTEATKIPWPEGGEKLIASRGDWQMNACLNFCRDSSEGYATGYKRAGDILVSYVSQTHRDQDRLVFPILFCYRHYLELRLKSIIRRTKILLEIAGEEPFGHRLEELWREARALVEKCYPGQGASDLENTGALVQQFAHIDPQSMAFRYAKNTKGGKHLPGITHINLMNVYEVVGRLAGFLDCVDEVAGIDLEQRNEMLGESLLSQKEN